MNDKFIIHGPPSKNPIPNVSLGIQVFEALQKQKISNAFIDAFTKRIITNKELLEISVKLAQAIEKYGLKQNDVIGIYSENSIMYFHPILACLYLGVIVATFNPQYSTSEFLHVANISQPKIIFCSVSTKSKLSKVIQQLKAIPKVVILDAENDDSDFDCLSTFIHEHSSSLNSEKEFRPKAFNIYEQVAFTLCSSGTTGLPKGVMLTHLNINAAFAISNDRSTEHILALLPFFHAYGLFVIFLKIITNQTIVIFNKFHPEVYLDSIQKYRIKYLHVIPSIAHFLATSKMIDKYDLSSVQKVLCGGAPLSENVQNLLRKRFNLQMTRQAYGMTETVVSFISPQDSNIKVGSCGKVRPFMSVKIVDPDTSESLGPMQRGEVYCRGLQVMKGYMNDTNSTNAAIDKNGWLRTGDVAYYDENGYFYIVDRLKELIKYKGFQVPPAEVEAILLKHPKIADAAVIGIPDERFGELPFAFVVKTEQLSEKDVQDFVASQLSPEKHLRGGVQFVDSLPRTLSGKILKNKLRNDIYRPKSKL